MPSRQRVSEWISGSVKDSSSIEYSLITDEKQPPKKPRRIFRELLFFLLLAALFLFLCQNIVEQPDEEPDDNLPNEEAFHRGSRIIRRRLPSRAAKIFPFAAAQYSKGNRTIKKPMPRRMKKKRPRGKAHSFLKRHTNHSKHHLPSCIIIGAKSCGGGALRWMLNHHPQIAVAPKDVNFFSDDSKYVQGLDWYKRAMPETRENQVTIEKSSEYLINEEAPGRVWDFNDTIKLILIVREPVHRVMLEFASSPMYVTKSEAYKISLDNLALNYDLHEPLMSLLIHSFYGMHLSHWLQYFPRYKIHIVDGEKLATENPVRELHKIERFLGLPHYFRSSMFRFVPQNGHYCFTEVKGLQCYPQPNQKSRRSNVSPQAVMKIRKILQKDTRLFLNIARMHFKW